LNGADAKGTSMRGGRNALLLISVSGLCRLCHAPAKQEGPPPTPDTISDLIYEWDKIERSNPPCPEAYRDQYVRALKALSTSLAETERERARQ
jgi:hypothetical protein